MFEYFIARRYLMAKRKQAVISVITVISILGVASGVMALIVALAINNGFRATLQQSLLGATAHLNIVEKQVDEGIPFAGVLAEKLARLPHVKGAAPTLYGNVLVSGPTQTLGCVLKGLNLASETQRADLRAILKQGSLESLQERGAIIIGSKLAQDAGLRLNSRFQLVSPQGEMTPYGPRPSYFTFRVVGIFESGFYDLDKTWIYTSLADTQRVLGLTGIANSIEIKLDDPQFADATAKLAEPIIGAKLLAIPWTEQNRQLMNALRLERTVTIVTIGLIQLVSALNIVITLVMMVMEKNRDIAVLMSLGAKPRQIQRIFLAEGALIGAIGTAIGLILGYGLSFLGDRFRWISLDEQVYALSYVPFDPRAVDGLWVAGVSLGISLLATLYPGRQAARVQPAEALRYE
ncbi:MAG: ABC transporter permease [Bryobacteraceae bacterium]|nr:ABC transporter permease [Bryobacteraceae bacterium]